MDINEFKVPYHIVRKRTLPESLGFRTTAELEPIRGLIGQKRAFKSIDFGLKVNSKGYNIFVAGRPGSGRTTYVLNKIKEVAKSLPSPSDWCYVYNFKEPSKPIALEFAPGKGRKFTKMMEDLIEEFKVLIPRAFEKAEYEDAKTVLVKEFQERVNQLMDELKKWALEQGFVIKRTPQGFVNIPIVEEEDENGNKKTREMKQEEFEQLPEEEQKRLQEISEKVSSKTIEVLREIRFLEKELQKKIKKLDTQICKSVISPPIEEIKNEFASNEKLLKWLEMFEEDVLEHFAVFIAASEEKGEAIEFTRYKVNAFVCREEDEGAPVIRETNPTYYNLMGKVEYDNKMGILYTDFTKIIPGAIHKANGGFLILEAEDILRNFMSWDALKRVLKTQEIRIENLGEQLGFIPVSSLRPESIPVNIKVVVIGPRWIYYLLSIYDQEFSKLFKIKADFDVDMERNQETEKGIARFIAGIIQRENLLPFTADAVAEVIEYASRLAGHQNRMSTQFNKIAEVVIESNVWALEAASDCVTAEHVRKAISEKTFRVNLIEERIRRLFEEGQMLIDVTGGKVGQINGLTVIDLKEHSFGKPVKITANCFMGEEGIVNIEREIKLAGPIHNKGVMILASYLGKQYSYDFPITLSARLTFEQTYEEIEGDSASSTELYCILSAIADLPLNQGIAVTGSVNQKGEVQPIGGVNEKIEGFYKYCKARGLTGKQGVIIPKQNLINLMLDHEVCEAVKEGKFHIWAVSHIDEGIEILTGVPAGKRDKEGKFPKGTVHYMVESKLREWFKKMTELSKKGSEKSEDKQ